SGQTIASVETEKAVVDVESDIDAIVHTLLVGNGATVPVGDPIAILLGVDEPAAEAEKLLADLGVGGAPAAGGGDAAAPAAETGPEAELDAAVRAAPEEAAAPDTPAPATASPQHVDVGAAAAANGNGGRQFTSPSARRLARELGVDITALRGSGPKGRVVNADVRAASQAAPAPAAQPAAAQPAAAPAAPAPAPAAAAAAPAAAVPEGWTAVPHTRVRRIIAQRLQESTNTAPHFYVRMSARVDELLALRAQLNASGRVKVSVNDFIVKAAAQALVDVPAMNVVWSDDAVLQAPTADVAVAVASEKGLVTPVIRDIASLSLSGLSSKIKDAVARANQGKLSTADLQGGTLTVSNLGMFGVEEFDAIINPPQAGILAVGAAVRKPVVGEGDTVEIASVLSLVLSVDHRPVDGTDGARWLARLKELLEDPMQIVV
ncbi:MAG TPA: dihydrolipoamide acetyltransferase family protein, partial [Pseudonocardia sp.]|nr:dihydrolipoamide acetyltransferase family protein [Pseudonocardia sp.]